MPIHHRISNWLESHWISPAYSGWLMLGLSLFFFAAATNTLAGWLYLISGVMLALLAIAAILPGRSLQGIRVIRRPLNPVSVGDSLIIELILENSTPRSKPLVQVQDVLPSGLGQPACQAIEVIPANDSYRWVYQRPAQRRGIYHWQTVEFRTAAPLGLFWCHRNQTVQTKAVVYPTVLPLAACPLVDEIGQDIHLNAQSTYRSHGATEGITRTLRSYRWGDPTRLVHWRTSARYGELRVRELEVFTGGQEFVICIDSANRWNLDDFEQAVIAAASLYFYAVHQHLQVSLWTAGTGRVRGDRIVLEALAATNSGESGQSNHPPNFPLVWLSQNSASLVDLPTGSRWLFWSQEADSREFRQSSPMSNYPGILIQPDQPLQLQLQAPYLTKI